MIALIIAPHVVVLALAFIVAPEALDWRSVAERALGGLGLSPSISSRAPPSSRRMLSSNPD